MSIVYYEVNSIDVSEYCRELFVINRANITGDTASFEMVDPDTAPVAGQAATIYLDDSSQVLFSGIIISIKQHYAAPNKWIYSLSCTGFVHYFNRRLVKEHYEDLDIPTTVTASYIINHIVTNYTDPAMGFTTNNVIYDAPIYDKWFNYVYPSDCLRELAEDLRCIWWIDKDRDVHFIHKLSGSETAPLAINDDNLETRIEGFRFSIDNSQIRNVIFVQGGYVKSDEETVNFVGNGEQRVWTLPYKPHDISLTVDGVSKTLGQENIDEDDGSYEYFYNYYEQTLFCADAEDTPANGIVIAVTMKYEYPLLKKVRDKAAIDYIADIEGGSGIYEYLIKGVSETSIFYKSEILAEHAGKRELKNFAYPKIRGSFTILDYYGFKSGQELIINVTGCSYNGTYTINQVTTESIGNNILLYKVEFEGTYEG